MNLRFPRLSAARAKPIVAELASLTLDEVETRASPQLTVEQFAATGAPRVTSDLLNKTRDELRAVLRGSGYPKEALAIRQTADRALAVALASLNLPVGEMLRPDVWAWMAVHLLPEYVHWRWVKNGSVTEERFSGSVVRNALGRLWLRGWVFDLGESQEDRWMIVNSLPEDATVAVLERTSVSSDHRLARAIARCWLSAGFDKATAERALRDAMIKARVSAAMFESAALSDQQLDLFVGELLASRRQSAYG